jgi:hypothetical protein
MVTYMNMPKPGSADLEDGAIFWCLLPSIKAANHAPDIHKMREPWQGKLRRAKDGTLLLSGIVNELTGEVRQDDDFTETISDSAAELFFSFEAAKAVYTRRSLDRIEHDLERLIADVCWLRAIVFKHNLGPG